MINEKRVRTMTQLAIFENNEGKKDKNINSYFKSDYISGQLLHTFISSTAAFVVIAVVYAFYNFESLMLEIYSMNLKEVMMQILLYYVIFIVVMLLLTLAVYMYRYKKARAGLERYYLNIKRLSDEYRKDEEQ